MTARLDIRRRWSARRDYLSIYRFCWRIMTRWRARSSAGKGSWRRSGRSLRASGAARGRSSLRVRRGLARRFCGRQASRRPKGASAAFFPAGARRRRRRCRSRPCRNSLVRSSTRSRCRSLLHGGARLRSRCCWRSQGRSAPMRTRSGWPCSMRYGCWPRTGRWSLRWTMRSGSILPRPACSGSRCGGSKTTTWACWRPSAPVTRPQGHWSSSGRFRMSGLSGVLSVRSA